MSFKKNIKDIKKNYSLGIIGGGQLALMLTEAAKKRDLEVCVQTKSCDDPAVSKADHVIEADPLKIRGNKSLINECEKIIFENEWIKIDNGFYRFQRNNREVRKERNFELDPKRLSLLIFYIFINSIIHALTICCISIKLMINVRVSFHA